jgi:hypothetical protein
MQRAGYWRQRWSGFVVNCASGHFVGSVSFEQVPRNCESLQYQLSLILNIPARLVPGVALRTPTSVVNRLRAFLSPYLAKAQQGGDGSFEFLPYQCGRKVMAYVNNNGY